MRVLFQIRKDYLETFGGDSVLLLRTVEQLRLQGVEVDVSTDIDTGLGAYDLVHVVDTAPTEETFLQGLNAVYQNTPLVITPTYWNMAEYERRGRWQPGTLEAPENPYVAERAPVARELILKAKRSYLLACADMVLPNSQAERDLIWNDFEIQHHRCLVIYSGADPEFAAGEATEFVEEYGWRDFVLCAARVEDRKNQLRLVEACRRLGAPLALIGDPHPHQQSYLHACREAAKDSPLLILGRMPPSALRAAYAAAKVHALVSWYETPGLASLEAALAGCNLVVTDRGPTREYFGELAWYCDPGDVNTVTTALELALQSPRSNELREHVRRRFTWQNAARETIRAYQAVLHSRERAKGPPSGRHDDMARQVVLLEELASAQEGALWLKSVLIEDLSRQLAEHKAVLADRERQLAEHKAVLAYRLATGLAGLARRLLPRTRATQTTSPGPYAQR